MSLLKNLFRPAVSSALAGGLLWAVTVPAFAGSTVIDGPGVRVAKHNGWFGQERESYQDAMGNAFDYKQGIFGRQSTRTRIFGSEATVRNNNNVTVRDATGRDLITTHRGLFGIGGRNTHIDGNGIYQSLKGVFNSSAPTAVTPLNP